MSSSAVRADLIQSLRSQLAVTQPLRPVRQIPTGLSSLDMLLPGGGLPVSGLMEWIFDEAGHSVFSLALRSLTPMLTLSGCLVVIDERHEFCAEAAVAQGIPMSRLLLVRPQQSVSGAPSAARVGASFFRRTSFLASESLWALEQAARCPGVRVVMTWMDRCSSAVMRRLQLAVERSGVVVMLIRPASVLSQPSFADLRLHVQALPQAKQSEALPRTYSVRLLRSRSGLQHDGIARVQQGPWKETIVCASESSATLV